MGKTRKDRHDRDYDDYYNERASRRKKGSSKERRRNNQNWKQFRNVTSDDVIDDCVGSDD